MLLFLFIFFFSETVKLGLISGLTEEDSMTSSVRLERYASGEINLHSKSSKYWDK